MTKPKIFAINVDDHEHYDGGYKTVLVIRGTVEDAKRIANELYDWSCSTYEKMREALGPDGDNWDAREKVWQSAPDAPYGATIDAYDLQVLISYTEQPFHDCEDEKL